MDCWFKRGHFGAMCKVPYSQSTTSLSSVYRCLLSSMKIVWNRINCDIIFRCQIFKSQCCPSALFLPNQLF
ncbi:hypothetical protein EG68_12431 [Paragonimus skrjabini miyazakii]|uniref:Uncharacterized protein n=1 Tax=Paragonimus skrjabini miyazakii TaxID=59628 RepID=A0A8S9YIK1_9TREM|nr:hypothetical protein EG68_12431 [Paragonimus skrjabini miyazakii]